MSKNIHQHFQEKPESYTAHHFPLYICDCLTIFISSTIRSLLNDNSVFQSLVIILENKEFSFNLLKESVDPWLVTAILVLYKCFLFVISVLRNKALSSCFYLFSRTVELFVPVGFWVVGFNSF